MAFDIIGVGEVLWDLLQTGPQLGGAPANFAYHAHALGARAYVITRVGSDDHGREIMRRFRDMGVKPDAVQIDERAPTGTARVTLSGAGLAHFTIQENVAWDFLAPSSDGVALAAQADAICFGSLGQRNEVSRNSIQKLVGAASAKALRIFDINLRQQFYSREVVERSLQLANVLKLNDDELPTVAGMFGLHGSIENQIRQLARAFDLHVVALTLGPNGSLLYQTQSNAAQPNNGRWSNCRSRAVRVVDTVGAGDSFTAALVLGLLCKMDLDEINEIASDVARYVCSQAGATPTLPVEFASKFVVDQRKRGTG
jgi:fructokinase